AVVVEPGGGPALGLGGLAVGVDDGRGAVRRGGRRTRPLPRDARDEPVTGRGGPRLGWLLGDGRRGDGRRHGARRRGLVVLLVVLRAHGRVLHGPQDGRPPQVGVVVVGVLLRRRGRLGLLRRRRGLVR